MSAQSKRDNDASQADLILRLLKKRKPITPLEALSKFGCLRLGARIYDLRRDGHRIVTDYETNGREKRWAKYRLQKA